MIGPDIDSRLAGGLGVYDPAEPCGPWTMAFYTGTLARSSEFLWDYLRFSPKH